MIVDSQKTLAELVADGLTPGDAVEVRAFAVWLRRNPRPADGAPRQVARPDYDYALGHVPSAEYLRAVVPGELP